MDFNFNKFVSQLEKGNTSATLNEALDTPASKVVGTLDEKVSWGYVPEKEYDGKRFLIIEKGEDDWVIFDFVEGKGGAKKPASKPTKEDDTKTESITSEILRYQSLVEDLYGDKVGVVGGGVTLKNKNGNVLLEGKITGPGKDNANFLQQWLLVEGTPYNFENCLKRCVEIVTGKDTGATPKGAKLNLTQFQK